MGIIYNDNKVIPHIDHSKYYNCKIWYNNVRQNSYDGDRIGDILPKQWHDDIVNETTNGMAIQ